MTIVVLSFLESYEITHYEQTSKFTLILHIEEYMTMERLLPRHSLHDVFSPLRPKAVFRPYYDKKKAIKKGDNPKLHVLDPKVPVLLFMECTVQSCHVSCHAQ